MNRGSLLRGCGRSIPSVYVSPLKLHSATKINLHGVSDSAPFRNHLKVRLSRLKSPVLRNSRSKYRSAVYLSISKCNAKRCSCCKHLHKSTFKFNVNGRQFSVGTNSDLDRRLSDLIYVYLEKRKIVAYIMLVKPVDLSITLKHSGRHMALSRLVTLSISSLPDFDIEAHKIYDRSHRLMMQHYLPGVTLKMLFGHI